MSLPALVYNGYPIGTRGKLVCLTDMWRQAGGPENKEPYNWGRFEGKEFIGFIAESLNLSDAQVWISEPGRGGGTWAHWQVAYAYARYISHEWHAWANTVLRAYMEGQELPAQRSDVVAGIFDLSNSIRQLAVAQDKRFDRIEDEQGKLRDDNRRIEGKVDNVVDIISRQPWRRKKRFGKTTKEMWRRVVRLDYNGYDPSDSGQKILDDDGNFLPNVEMDHMNGEKNSWLDGWPVPRFRNLEMQVDEVRERFRYSYWAVFIARLEKRFPDGKIPKEPKPPKPKKPREPDLFDLAGVPCP